MGATTHGMWKTSEYSTWSSMKARCSNPNNTHYYLYGGRGITVCERWQKFEAFFEDMGKKPSKQHSIDRIDNEKGYSKDNCKWATPKEQCRNMRSNANLTFKGKTVCLSAWSEEIGIARDTLQDRLKRGWSTEKTLTTKVREGNYV